MDRRRRAHVPVVPDEGALAVLGDDEAHHVARVLRLGPGDPVSVFDGRGREWDAVVVSVDRQGAVVRIGAELDGRVDPTLPIDLFQALCRPERMDWVVQKGTEVGVVAVHPFRASRSSLESVSPERVRRWARIALEAAKQSGRRVVPTVSEPIAFLPVPPAETCALLLDASEGTPPLGERLAGARPPAVWIAVGPEGGFEDEELRRLEERGWRRASLGPRVLRTETAGVVASALVLHVWDDLGSAPTARVG